MQKSENEQIKNTKKYAREKHKIRHTIQQQQIQMPITILNKINENHVR